MIAVRKRMWLVAACAVLAGTCVAEKLDLYNAFLSTNAATRRAWMDDADMRKRMARLGTPPTGAPDVSG